MIASVEFIRTAHTWSHPRAKRIHVFYVTPDLVKKLLGYLYDGFDESTLK